MVGNGDLRRISVLLVEDSEDDALLLLRELRRGGYEPHYERVQTPEAMEKALAGSDWDVVVSDHRMPHFGALEAEAEFPGHLGLRSMRERAQRLDGTLNVEATPGSGTTIHAHISTHRSDALMSNR